MYHSLEVISSARVGTGWQRDGDHIPRTEEIALLQLVIRGHHGKKRCRLGQEAVYTLSTKERLYRISQTKRLVENEWCLEIGRDLWNYLVSGWPGNFLMEG